MSSSPDDYQEVIRSTSDCVRAVWLINKHLSDLFTFDNDELFEEEDACGDEPPPSEQPTQRPVAFSDFLERVNNILLSEHRLTNLIDALTREKVTLLESIQNAHERLCRMQVNSETHQTIDRSKKARQRLDFVISENPRRCSVEGCLRVAAFIHDDKVVCVLCHKKKQQLAIKQE